MQRTALAALLLGWVLLAPAGARDYGPETSSVWVNAYDEAMSRTLDEAGLAEEARDWRKAATLYQDAARRATNEVRRVESRTYLGIREYVKTRIRSWPPEGLAVYRGMVDPRVREGRAAAMRDGRPEDLRSIVREYPLSTPGARTMLDLGTWFLSRGDPDLALRQFLEILRLYPEGDIPEVDRAEVLARAGAAAAARGHADIVAEMRTRAAALPGMATVRVGGGAEPLGAFLARLPMAADGSAAAEGWNTVGGTAARSGGRDGPTDPLTPYWSRRIPFSRARVEEMEDPDQSPLFPVHALLVPGAVVVPAPLLVQALSLPVPGILPLSGRPELLWTFPSWDPSTANAPNSAVRQIPPFATRSGDVVAMPFPDTAGEPYEATPGDDRVVRNALVTLSLRAEGKLLDQRGGLDPEYEDTFRDFNFCGAPAIEGERLWVSGTRPGNRVETLVFCFDLSGRPGRLRLAWKTSICLGRGEENPDWWLPFDEQMEASSVAVKSGVVYVCSNTGAVAALDAAGGEIIWVHKYERTERPPNLYSRETKKLETWFPNPPVLDHRYLYVAPLDSDSLFIYFQLPDPTAGYVAHGRFSRREVDLGFEPRYLLGAREGVVFLAGETRKRERPLFAVKAGPAWLASGEGPGDPQRILWRAEIQEDRPCGRGVLAADGIYFPTEKAIYRVRASDGEVTRLADLSDERVTSLAGGENLAGNLAVAGPWLVSVTEERVTLFGPAPEKEDRETGD